MIEYNVPYVYNRWTLSSLHVTCDNIYEVWKSVKILVTTY